MNRLVVLAVAWTLAAGAQAQTFTWTKTGGPLGGLGYNVRIHPTNKNLMFVTDAWTGVNRSTDGGMTWRASNTGITTRTGPSNDAIPVFSLAIDASAPDTMWVGTQGQRGIFKSTDGGTTWVKSDNGIAEDAGLTIRHFQIDPANSQVVYASAEVSTGIQGIEFERVQGALYKTTDGGANWSRIWLGDSLARWLAIDPANPQAIAMATGIFDREAVNITGVGTLRTTNGGTSWATVNQGLTSLFVGALAMHATRPLTYLIATGSNFENNAGKFGGVHLTTNGGISWTRVIAPHDPASAGSQDNVFNALAYAPGNPHIVYAGNAFAFYRSADGGLTWTRHAGTNGLAYGPAGVRAGVPIEITVDADDVDTVFVNNYGGGVFKSVDGARSWQVWSKGYTGADIHQIAVSAQHPSQLLAIGRSGPFTSTDAGQNWTGVLNGTAFAGEGGEWYSAAIHPGDANILLIGDEHQGGLFRSADGGASWTLAYRHPFANTTQYGRQGIQTIQFSKSQPKTVYAGFASEGFYSAPNETVGHSSFGVYRSDDAGVSWTARNSGLSSTNMNVSAIAVSATDPAVVYAGLRGDGMYKSVDSGANWNSVTGSLPTGKIHAIALSAADSAVVYVGTGDQGIYKSTNGGAAWTQVLDASAAGSTPAQKVIMALVVDPGNASKVYAADWNSGVFRSVDAGQTWQQMNSGLTTRAIETMAISSDGRNLYVGTKGEGVFRIDTATGGDVSMATGAAVVPDAPTISSIVDGIGSATVAFTAPGSAGSSAIDQYTASCSASGQTTRSASHSGSPVTVSGLTGGIIYGCTVKASNAAGASPASALLLARPTGDTAYTAVVEQIYLSYFGRPADTVGLANLSNALSAAQAPTDLRGIEAAYKTNATVRDLLNNFGNSAESNALYAGSTADFVGAIYTNILNRTADAAGLKYWADAINNGELTKAAAAISIAAGALGNVTPQGLLDAASVSNKTTVATTFTMSSTEQERIGYAGDSAAATARAMLATVSSATDVNAFRSTVRATLRTILADSKP